MIFEREYLNGKKDKKGKKYNNDGELIFEGEYENGLRNGNGKEYYNQGHLLIWRDISRRKKMEWKI